MLSSLLVPSNLTPSLSLPVAVDIHTLRVVDYLGFSSTCTLFRDKFALSIVTSAKAIRSFLTSTWIFDGCEEALSRSFSHLRSTAQPLNHIPYESIFVDIRLYKKHSIPHTTNRSASDLLCRQQPMLVCGCKPGQSILGSRRAYPQKRKIPFPATTWRATYPVCSLRCGQYFMECYYRTWWLELMLWLYHTVHPKTMQAHIQHVCQPVPLGIILLTDNHLRIC